MLNLSKDFTEQVIYIKNSTHVVVVYITIAVLPTDLHCCYVFVTYMYTTYTLYTILYVYYVYTVHSLIKPNDHQFSSQN